MAALAFLHVGSRQPNISSRETAAQFLASLILTETLGPGGSLSELMTSHMLKCAALFTFEYSPLLRYCMFLILMQHANFHELKDLHLEVGTSLRLTKTLESLGTKFHQKLLPSGTGVAVERHPTRLHPQSLHIIRRGRRRHSVGPTGSAPRLSSTTTALPSFGSAQIHLQDPAKDPTRLSAMTGSATSWVIPKVMPLTSTTAVWTLKKKTCT